MSKKDKTENKPTELPLKAFGLHKNADGDWMLDQINYDPETGESRLVSMKPTDGNDSGLAMERLLLAVEEEHFNG